MWTDGSLAKQEINDFALREKNISPSNIILNGLIFSMELEYIGISFIQMGYLFDWNALYI